MTFNFEKEKLVTELKKIKPKKVRAYFRPTLKNSQVRDFYKIFDFYKMGSYEDEDIWERDLNDYVFNQHDFIKINMC